MEKLISVIVATYKRSEGLIPTLESIRLQEYKNKELIITDDGSGKEIIEIIDNYLDKFKDDFFSVTFVKNKINLGIVKNIQNAYRIANGEIIKVLSPGDLFYDKNVLEKINRYFIENKPLIACGIPRTYSIKGNNLIHMDSYNLDVYANLINSKITYYNLLFASRCLIGATLVFHRDIFKKLNFFLPESIRYAEDLVQILAVLKGLKIHLLSGYLIWYEFGSGVSTNNNVSDSNVIVQDYILFYKWVISDNSLDKKIVRDVSIKIDSYFKNDIFSRFLRYIKSINYCKFKIYDKFMSNKLNKKAIKKYGEIFANSKDNFEYLIKEGLGNQPENK